MTACWDNGDGTLARAAEWKEDAARSLSRVDAELEEMDHPSDDDPTFDATGLLRRF